MVPRCARPLVVALTAALAAGAAAAPAAQARSCPAPSKRTIAYAERPGVPKDRTSLDLYVPGKRCLAGGRGKAPVVLWFHGGGYRVGDKRNAIADKVRLFTGRGYLFASVNYRLTDGSPRQARWPDHFRDGAAAIAWARANAKRWGGDGRRIAILGHSAGADLVSNLAVDPTWLRERRLRLSALRCAAPIDTDSFDKTRDSARGSRLWEAAFGNIPDWRTRTSASLLIRRGVGIPPTLTVARGIPRRVAIQEDYLRRLAAAGVRTTLVRTPTLSHEGVNRAIGRPGDTIVTPPLTRFLRSCLGR